jgi:hypothetical protein
LLESLKERLKDIIRNAKHSDQNTNKIFFPIGNQSKNMDPRIKSKDNKIVKEINLPKKTIDFVLVNYEKDKKKFNINALV